MNKGSLCWQFSLCWTFAKRSNVEYQGPLLLIFWPIWLRFDRRLKPSELLLNLHSIERKANLPYFQISIFANLWNNFSKLLPTFCQNWERLQDCDIETSDQNWGEREPSFGIFSGDENVEDFRLFWCNDAIWNLVGARTGSYNLPFFPFCLGSPSLLAPYQVL